MLCSYLLLHLCLAYCVSAEGHMHVVRDLLLSGADWRLRSVRSFFLSLSLSFTHTHTLSLSLTLYVCVCVCVCLSHSSMRKSTRT